MLGAIPKINKIKSIKADIIRAFNFYCLSNRGKKVSDGITWNPEDINTFYTREEVAERVIEASENDEIDFKSVFITEEGFQFLLEVFDFFGFAYKCKTCSIKSRCCHAASVDLNDCDGVKDMVHSSFVDYLFSEYYKKTNNIKSLIY